MGYEQIIVPSRTAQQLGAAVGKCRVTGAADLTDAINLFRE